MDETTAKNLLKEHGLRSTTSRVQVLVALEQSDGPVSWAEMKESMGTEVEPATLFRTLRKLTDVGITEVVGHFDGCTRYALSKPKGEGDHLHPHFVCDDCGQIACLPDDIIRLSKRQDRWAASVKAATLQLRGECPDCRVATTEA